MLQPGGFWIEAYGLQFRGKGLYTGGGCEFVT